MDLMVEQKLRAAVRGLDPEDDALWEADGKPKALAVYYHFKGYGTLADAEEVVASMPDYDREAARAAWYPAPEPEPA